MTVWIRHSGSNWEMHDHIELQAARWSHETGGTKYFQFKYKWDAHGNTFATNGITTSLLEVSFNHGTYISRSKS